MIVERPSLERRVIASLNASRIPVVLGGCGMGRTSLLRRVQHTVGADLAQYLDLGACATTPEQCLHAVTGVTRFTAPEITPSLGLASGHAAFTSLMGFLDRATAAGGAPATFLVDEWLELRTFESFPGLRHVQREAINRLATSSNRFVLASRFTSRMHRLLRDAPARFEVVHTPRLSVHDVQALALARNAGSPEWAARIAPSIAALSGGRVAYAMALLDALSTPSTSDDVIAVFTRLIGPAGRLTALARFSYELRLHRARGYGALKAILGILAQDEPLTLTEISLRLRRTPGSTKDYLSWLEDVDLLAVERKRYAFEDPLLRLFVRLYGRATPATDDEIRREVEQYAAARTTTAPEPVAPAALEPAVAAADRAADGARDSGIIEID